MNPILFLLTAVATSYAANFPTEYQAALRLYGSNKFPEAKAAALMQAGYCEVQLKHVEEATSLASGIKDKYFSKLCSMILLTMQSKYEEVVMRNIASHPERSD